MNHSRLATVALVALVGLALGTLVFPMQGEAVQAQTMLTPRTTGDLHRARGYQTASRLHDGHELVAGSRDAPPARSLESIASNSSTEAWASLRPGVQG